MTTAARASGPRLRVLRALHDNPVEDRAGRAVNRLCEAARFDRQDALAQVLARMDAEGLIRREVQGRRTYRIEITAAGRRLAGLPRSAEATDRPLTPGRLRFDALPPGPASTWNRGAEEAPIDAGQPGVADDPVVEVSPPGAGLRLVPALAEVAGDPAAVDYEVLAGVLLQTALRVIRNGEGEELAAHRRIVDLETQVQMLERNNRTLAEALARARSTQEVSLPAPQGTWPSS